MIILTTDFPIEDIACILLPKQIKSQCNDRIKRGHKETDKRAARRAIAGLSGHPIDRSDGQQQRTRVA